MKNKMLTAIISGTLAIVLLFASITTFAMSISSASYAEYLSAEKSITKFYTNDLGFVFYIDEVSGYLYKLDLKTKESVLILQSQVKENIEYGDRVYCILENNNVVSIKYDGTGLKTLYQNNIAIKNLWTDGEALFFQKGNSICRYHIQSKTLDILVTSENIVYFRPFTNLEVKWTEYTDEWIEYIESDKYVEDSFALYGTYIGFEGEMITYKSYDDSSKRIINLDQEIEFVDSKFSLSSIKEIPRAVSVNRGKIIPLEEYPVGSYFSDTLTNPCTCNPHGSNYCPISGSCGCRAGINRTGGSCIQCIGFVYTAYRTIWDQPTADFSTFVTETPSVSFTDNSYGLAQLKTFFESLDWGSMTIAPKKGGGQHAYMIAYVDGDRVAVYDANVNSKCDICYRFVSFEYLHETYASFGYIYQRPN